jgi:hypothetical protein
MLGVTTSHLSESLRLETGLTAGELIRGRLLLEAKRLLLHSELTIAEIGYVFGSLLHEADGGTKHFYTLACPFRAPSRIET